MNTTGGAPKRLARYAVAGGSAVAVISASGIAWATWTNSASGNAAAGGGTLALTINSAGTSFSNKLFPGAVTGQASGATEGGDLVLVVTNPQNFAVKITGLTQNGPVTVDSTHNTAGCTSDTIGTSNSTGGNNISAFGTSGVGIGSPLPSGTGTTTYTQYSPGGTLATVAANASSATLTIPNVVGMSTTSNNACQGATFTMPVILNLSM